MTAEGKGGCVDCCCCGGGCWYEQHRCSCCCSSCMPPMTALSTLMWAAAAAVAVGGGASCHTSTLGAPPWCRLRLLQAAHLRAPHQLPKAPMPAVCSAEAWAAPSTDNDHRSMTESNGRWRVHSPTRCAHPSPRSLCQPCICQWSGVHTTLLQPLFPGAPARTLQLCARSGMRLCASCFVTLRLKRGRFAWLERHVSLAGPRWRGRRLVLLYWSQTGT
jgi:hypothetical protein